MSKNASFVLDASALLALFNQEKGWEEVERVISRDDAVICMSAINYAEVLSKVIARGETLDAIINDVRTLDIRIIDFDSVLAEQVGILKPRVASWGLSLGDCACLVLARHLDATALTADTAWAHLAKSYRIMFIR